MARQGRRQGGGRKPAVISGKVFEGELERTMWAWDRWLELHLEANPRFRPEIVRELDSIRICLPLLERFVILLILASGWFCELDLTVLITSDL